MKTDLSVDLGFLKLRNPVLAASGTFGYGTEFAPFLDLSALGGVVVKGLYYGPREGNPPPRIVETASGMINAIGLQGVGVEAFAADVLPELRKAGASVWVNVCGEDEDEYLRVIGFLDRLDGLAAYELNISCPNVKRNGLCPALRADWTFDLVRAAKARSRRPVVAKLSPNVTDIVEIARAAERAGADGVSLVNTFLAMAIDPETRRPRLANGFGGLSGPAIKPIALRMVYQAASAVKIPVIGMGGVMTGRDAVEFLIAGAKAVEVGTANFVDPASTVRVIGDIEAFCLERGIARVSDLVGTVRI
ncbi:MAG: dihydroorotate dehydrogenase [Candidatus Aminicenantes bacterium]|nr:dihydroorotate dehydrogenase [Candidatus Aminicenantes bacterium]